MPNSDSQSGIQTITPQDLADPTCAKLNNVLQFLASQIAAVQGASGVTKLKGTVSGKSFSASDTSVPKDDTSVLTKKAGDSLYAPIADIPSGPTVDIKMPGGFTVGNQTFFIIHVVDGSIKGFA